MHWFWFHRGKACGCPGDGVHFRGQTIPTGGNLCTRSNNLQRLLQRRDSNVSVFSSLFWFSSPTVFFAHCWLPIGGKVIKAWYCIWTQERFWSACILSSQYCSIFCDPTIFYRTHMSVTFERSLPNSVAITERNSRMPLFMVPQAGNSQWGWLVAHWWYRVLAPWWQAKDHWPVGIKFSLIFRKKNLIWSS